MSSGIFALCSPAGDEKIFLAMSICVLQNGVAGMHLSSYIPRAVSELPDSQTLIPTIAKSEHLLAQIEGAARAIPTQHRLIRGDSRDMGNSRMPRYSLS